MTESDEENTGLDDPFSMGEIFTNRDLLRVGHVPNEERIVGRDEEIKNVGRVIAPATEGGPPQNTIIYGKTGTGKSLVTRHLGTRAEYRAEDNGYTLVYVYIDCSDADTPTRIARSIAQQVAEKVDPEREIPVTGLGASEYLNHYLYDLLDGVDSLLVVLDEIDKMRNNDILMQQ